MTSEKFNFIINNFKPNDENQLSDLKILFNKYPYSQTISAYYLKSLKDQNKNNFNHILRRTAILSFDRSNLRNWISSNINKEKQRSEDKKDIQIEDKFTFLDWFDHISSNKSKINEKIDLIESFIDNKSERIIENNDKDYKFNISKSDKDNPELVTETLAKILTNQKKYKKAIKAYRILSLKYPKKSSFFADHIREIKKLDKE